jgi:hypothetical protein
MDAEGAGRGAAAIAGCVVGALCAGEPAPPASKVSAALHAV